MIADGSESAIPRLPDDLPVEAHALARLRDEYAESLRCEARETVCRHPVALRTPVGAERGWRRRCGSRDPDWCPTCALQHDRDVRRIAWDGYGRRGYVGIDFARIDERQLVAILVTATGNLGVIVHTGARIKGGKVVGGVCTCCRHRHPFGDLSVVGSPHDRTRFPYAEAAEFAANAGALFSVSIQNVRRSLSGEFAYFAVPECSKSGVVHFHSLVFVFCRLLDLDIYTGMDGRICSREIEVRMRATSVSAKGTGHRIGWGPQLKAILLATPADARRTMKYLLSGTLFGTKDQFIVGSLIRGASDETERHYATLQAVSGMPTGEAFAYSREELAALTARAKLHINVTSLTAFGFRGDSFRRSTNWSTLTLSGLSEARRVYARSHPALGIRATPSPSCRAERDQIRAAATYYRNALRHRLRRE